MARSTNHGKNSLWRSWENKSNLWVGSWWYDTPNSKSSYSEIQHLPEHLAEEKLWHTTNDSGQYGFYFRPVWQDDPQTSQEIIYLQGVRHLWLWPVCPYPIWTKTWIPRWYNIQVLHHPWYYEYRSIQNIGWKPASTWRFLDTPRSPFTKWLSDLWTLLNWATSRRYHVGSIECPSTHKEDPENKSWSYGSFGMWHLHWSISPSKVSTGPPWWSSSIMWQIWYCQRTIQYSGGPLRTHHDQCSDPYLSASQGCPSTRWQINFIGLRQKFQLPQLKPQSSPMIWRNSWNHDIFTTPVDQLWLFDKKPLLQPGAVVRVQSYGRAPTCLQL